MTNLTTAAAPVRFMQRWNAIQYELIPQIQADAGVLTLRLEKVIHTLEWVRIEEFIAASWCGVGRPPHERSWLANAFVAKAVLGLGTTSALIGHISRDGTAIAVRERPARRAKSGKVAQGQETAASAGAAQARAPAARRSTRAGQAAAP